MASTPKKTAITKKTTTSKGSDSVRALQTSLNAKGANLKVDGISGPLTKAAQAKYGSSSSSNLPPRNDTNYDALSKQNSTTKKSSVVNIPKSSIFANPFSGAGFLKNVLGGAKMVGSGAKNFVKDSISTINSSGKNVKNSSNALSGFEDANIDPFYNLQQNPSDFQINPDGNSAPFGTGVTPMSPMEIVKNLVNPPPVAPVNNYSSNTQPTDPTALSPGQFGGETQAPVASGALSGSTDKTSTDTTTSDTSAFAATSEARAGSPTVNLGVSSDTLNGLGKLNMGINDTTMSNDPFLSKESKGEFQNNTIINYADNAAKLWNSPEQATAFYNTPQGQEMVKDFVTKGGKVTDIIAKIKPLQTNVNGLQPAQTTAEYLQGGQASLRDERNAMNDMIANELNYTQQQKDILFGKKDPAGNDILLGIAAQQKKDNEERIAYYDRLEARFDKNEKEKTRNAIDKARAEFEMKDAEVEMARINAKNNLTEFLAKIGALRTDGNALLGIEKLEQSYQAQRQQLRQNFQFAEREIRQASEEKMFNLETDLEDKKFKLSQDLSKTEREVMMDSMKLDYDFNKTLNNLKLKWTESIKDEREKAAAKAEKLAGDWTNQYLTSMGADMFKSLPAEFRNTWLSNNPIDPNGYKTTQTDLAKTFAEWQKNQNTGLQLTDTQVFNLQKQGVDVEAYKADPEYRAAVNSNLE